VAPKASSKDRYNTLRSNISSKLGPYYEYRNKAFIKGSGDVIQTKDIKFMLRRGRWLSVVVVSNKLLRSLEPKSLISPFSNRLGANNARCQCG
jgi:hypothetical protein